MIQTHVFYEGEPDMSRIWSGVVACLMLGGCGDTSSSGKGTEKKDERAPGAVAAGSRDKAPNKEKLIGIWEVTRGALPPGSTMEFARDGKLTMVVREENKILSKSVKGGKITQETLPGVSTGTKRGTYELDGDAVTAVDSSGGKEIMKIRSLTDTELVLTDEQNDKVIELKKR